MENRDVERDIVKQEFTNKGKFVGKILTDPIVDHTFIGKDDEEVKMMQVTIGMERLSGAIDEIPIVFLGASEKYKDLKKDNEVIVFGAFESYDVKQENGSTKLKLFINPWHVEIYDKTKGVKDPNEIKLKAVVAKEAFYKEPSGRKLASFVVKTIDKKNQSNYIPVVAWGNYAEEAQKLKAGEKLLIKGRVQSRKYYVNNGQDDADKIERTAYEVSAKSYLAIKE